MSSEARTPAARARALARAARVRWISRRICADARSRRRLVELFAAGRFEPPGEPEPINLKALGGDPVFIRPGSSDPDVLIGAFDGRYHLPASDLEPPALVWDLGTNIGLTILQMAIAYPDARFVGVELDSDNLALAERNLEPVRDRVELIEGAVWTEPGTIAYGTPEGGSEDAFRVSESGGGTATAVPLDELLERFGPPGYVKMDIEGAEREVLATNTGWAAEVTQLGVEYHEPYGEAECRAALEALGFNSFQEQARDLRHRGGDSIFAFRR